MTVLTAINPYDILRVSHNATDQEIMQAYQTAIRRLHPDTIDWRNPDRMAYAERHFVRLSFAQDTLINTPEHKRQTSTLYDYDVKPVSVTAWPRISNSDRAFYTHVWRGFISEPYGWTEKSKRMLDVWRMLCVAAFVASATIFGLLLWIDIAPRLLVYLMTTYWAPFTYSFVPLQVGIVCAVLAIAILITSCAYFASLYPYSVRHSTKFRRFFIDRTFSILAVPAWFGGTFGVVVGHYFF